MEKYEIGTAVPQTQGKTIVDAHVDFEHNTFELGFSDGSVLCVFTGPGNELCAEFVPPDRP